MNSLFALKKIRRSTVSGFNLTLFLLTMLPATLKTLSDGADIAGIAKIQDANLHTLGYFE
jgi:hypothetical protein